MNEEKLVRLLVFLILWTGINTICIIGVVSFIYGFLKKLMQDLDDVGLSS